MGRKITQNPENRRYFSDFITEKHTFRTKFRNFAGNKAVYLMYKGDIQTIATEGFDESQTKDVIVAMAKEELGAREAIWSGIHRTERRYRDIIAAFWILALCLIAMAAAVLWKCL